MNSPSKNNLLENTLNRSSACVINNSHVNNKLLSYPPSCSPCQ